MGDEAGRAYEKSLTFLERRSRTESEVSERLSRAGFSEEVIMETLERLRSAGLVDDKDYAERYMEALHAKGRGQRRIADEMRLKGLPDDIIRSCIDEGITREGEIAAASEIAVRLFEQLGVREPDRDGMETDEWDIMQKKMQKINRKLVSLGYPYSVIGEVMTKLRNEL